VLKYFPCTHKQAIRDLLLHCASALQLTSIGFLKIDALQDVTLRRNRLYHLERPWHNPFEEKRLTRNKIIKFERWSSNIAALLHRRLALSTAA